MTPTVRARVSLYFSRELELPQHHGNAALLAERGVRSRGMTTLRAGSGALRPGRSRSPGRPPGTLCLAHGGEMKMNRDRRQEGENDEDCKPDESRGKNGCAPFSQRR